MHMSLSIEYILTVVLRQHIKTMRTSESQGSIEPSESVSQINLDIDLSEPGPSGTSSASFLSQFSTGKPKYPDHYLVIKNDPVTLTRATSILGVRTH
jgi:hypothetical protein